MRNMVLAIGVALSAHTGLSLAWDGYDWEKGKYVEIDSGTTVRKNREIEVYEYGSGYKSVDVESIRDRGSKVELEVRDVKTGEYRTFEMDKRE